MSTRTRDHRPGVLVVDHDQFVFVDLDTGEVDPVRLDAFDDIWGRPELQLVQGAAPSPPMRFVPFRDVGPGSGPQVIGLRTPHAFRLDAGRVLAWDPMQNSHVELSLDHLRVLDAARSLLTWDEAAAVAPSGAELLAHLLSLSIVDVLGEEVVELPRGDGEDTSSVAEPEPEAIEATPIADEPPPPLPGLLEGLPDGLLARAHVLTYRVVGRALKASSRRRVRRARASSTRHDLSRDQLGATLADTRPPDPAPEQAEAPDPVDAAPAPAAAQDVAVPGGADVDPAVADDRVPVIPLYRWGEVSDDQGYGEKIEPSLSVGMLFATARAHDDGALNAVYDLRRLRPFASEVLEEWEQDPRPAVFVFSDYLWNVRSHLEMSERVKRISPDSVCIHGGPSVPKYDDDVRQFFADNPSVDIAAHGEGEVTFVEVLERLDGRLGPGCVDRLADTPGLTYRTRTADGEQLVTTAERGRVADLDQFPSPYLTGEFDDLLSVEWRSASVETNRGCPYGCTYCDWGSATLSRIRKFDVDRVMAELEWIQQHAGPSEMHIADANFGIFSRDVDIAERIGQLRRQYGSPYALTISLAKNTVKYSAPIIETLVNAGVSPITATSAVQTVDPDTLIAIERQNIKLEKYDELAVTFTELGIPLVTDLLMGLPGASVESFKNDLQHCFDREVTPRTMEIIMLPNSPMNEPAYKERYALEVDEHGVIVGSSTYTRDDYQEMRRLRLMYRAADHFGVFRQILRYLQWDHRLRAIDVIHDLDRAVVARGNRYPLLAFVSRVFDLYTMPPVAWEPLYDEFVEFLGEQYGIELSSDLAAVVRLQRHLMPSAGRTFPEALELEHDVVAYRADHQVEDGVLQIQRRLDRYPPVTVTIDDPGDICGRYIRRNDFPGRRTATTGNLFWVGYDWELDSPFVRHLATNVGRFEREAV